MEQIAFDILIADDNEVILKSLNEIFTKIGFNVVTAKNGQQAVDLALHQHPDLIMLDYHMPEKNGFDVVEELRRYPSFTNIPIIILTSDTSKELKLQGLSRDIDDFITMSADEDEIVARVKLLIKRSLQRIDSNPLTKLPGNPSIQARIEREINSGRKFAVIYADLNNFKEYNDAYGFKSGDNILLKTADIIVKSARKFDDEAFIGNIGGDDFVAVTKFEAAQNVAQEIVSEISKNAPQFYNEADKTKGSFTAVNRKGEKQDFPLLSISISVAHNNLKPLTSYAQVSYIASELKHFAKSWGGNYIAFDRRSR
ncbi:MAG: response regulator [Elusimicrobiota bacterium]|jgi:diguanylate cyclase (GGDEF)-like protein|nr:response regulator [Elusimicrobiota bacterium]